MRFAFFVTMISSLPWLALFFTVMQLSGCVDTETLTATLPLLSEWWSLPAFAAIAWTGGQAAKALAPAAETHPGWKFFWRTLPYHPVVGGILFGLSGVGPLPTFVTKAHGSGALYYGLAGVLATYGHDLWVTWTKYKHIDMDEKTDGTL